MKSRANAQLNLPPVELRSSEQAEPTFRNSEPNSDALGESEQLAARLFEDAVTRARMTSKDVAHLCGVSVSLVEKWRSTEARGCPSFVQLLMLPPAFHLELHRAMNRRFGFGRQLLARILDDLGGLALAAGE